MREHRVTGAVPPLPTPIDDYIHVSALYVFKNSEIIEV